jgi:hypothetical protein
MIDFEDVAHVRAFRGVLASEATESTTKGPPEEQQYHLDFSEEFVNCEKSAQTNCRFLAPDDVSPSLPGRPNNRELAPRRSPKAATK